MDKRTYPRINTIVSIKFLLGHKVYLGTVTNFSEKGMLIHSAMQFPLKWSNDFKVLLIIRDRRILVPVRIVRLFEFEHYYNSIAVEVNEAPKEYFDFVESNRGYRRIRRGEINSSF
jgi:hypothetical protein